MRTISQELQEKINESNSMQLLEMILENPDLINDSAVHESIEVRHIYLEHYPIHNHIEKEQNIEWVSVKDELPPQGFSEQPDTHVLCKLTTGELQVCFILEDDIWESVEVNRSKGDVAYWSRQPKHSVKNTDNIILRNIYLLPTNC